jgi:hypothetical protein
MDGTGKRKIVSTSPITERIATWKFAGIGPESVDALFRRVLEPKVRSATRAL